MAYTKDYNKENMAKAKSLSLPLSPKHCIEIFNFIRNKEVKEAKKILTRVINKEAAIPFRRFNGDVGHKKGMAAGRFPEKSSKGIIKLLEAAEANAQFKGLNTSDLVIRHICANRAAKTMRYGRKRSRRAKRTSIEVVVEEKKRPQKKAGEKKPQAKEKKAKENKK